MSGSGWPKTRREPRGDVVFAEMDEIFQIEPDHNVLATCHLDESTFRDVEQVYCEF